MGQGRDLLHRVTGVIFAVVEMFYIIIVVLVIQLYTFVKTH